MPQMSPINWILIYMMTIFFISVIFIIIYFIFSLYNIMSFCTSESVGEEMDTILNSNIDGYSFELFIMLNT